MSPLEPARVSLAALPTPLVRLERLGRELGGARVWIKRDDLTGLELSGNKIRKLEYIAAEMQAQNYDTLITEGTPQSNHCRAAAAMCARLGLQCVLVLRPPPPDGPPQGNHLLDELFGVVWRAYDRAEWSDRRGEIYDALESELRRAGRRPRRTPMGASEPLGCWGYIRAFRELADQLRAEGIHAADIVFAASSGGTAAGLALGQALHGAPDYRLWPVPVSDDVAWQRKNIGDLCRRTIDLFGLKLDAATLVALDYVDGYVGPGYAIPYPAVFDAMRRLARLEAIVLDPVYTGKAFCALLDGVKTGTFGRDRPVVFVHTGGIFSNFAWPDAFA